MISMIYSNSTEYQNNNKKSYKFFNKIINIYKKIVDFIGQKSKKFLKKMETKINNS